MNSIAYVPGTYAFSASDCEAFEKKDLVVESVEMIPEKGIGD